MYKSTRKAAVKFLCNHHFWCLKQLNKLTLGLCYIFFELYMAAATGLFLQNSPVFFKAQPFTATFTINRHLASL